MPEDGKKSGASSDNDELSQIDLDEGGASGSEADLPPTLYDPAALTLDPKHKAQLEKEAHEREERGSDSSSENGRKQNLLVSPHSPAPGLDPYRIEEQNLGDVEEVPVCCCGVLKFRTAVFLVSTLAGLVGIALLVVGVFRMQTGIERRTHGFSTGDSLLLNGPSGFNLSCLAGGMVFLVLSILGFTQARQIVTGKGSGGQKAMYVVYQALSVLAMAGFLAIFSLYIVGLTLLKSKDVYDQAHWESTLTFDPAYLCEIQNSLGCVGFEAGQCSSDSGEVVDGVNERCPGHFCLGFCRVTQGTNVNPSPVCNPCKVDFNFQPCKEMEESTKFRSKACAIPLEDTLSQSYLFGILFLGPAVLCSILLVMVAGFRACCLAGSNTAY